MKLKSKNFMQVDFNSIRILGIHAANILAYLISQSNIQNSDTVICEHDLIRKDLGTAFTKHIISSSIKTLLEKNLISVIHNYRARINGYRLNVENIDKLIGNEVNLIGNEVNLIGNEVNLIGNEVNLIGNEVNLNVENIDKLIGNEVNLIGNEVNLIGNEVNLIGNEVTPFNTDIKGIDIKNTSQAKACLSPQAEERILTYQDFNTSDEYLAYLRIQERKKQDIQQDLGVHYTDNEKDIQVKAKVARKTRTKKQDIQLEDKWSSFIYFINNEFGILYPSHRDINKTKAAAIEFAKDNSSMTLEDIEKMIIDIRNHYIKYCETNGKYAKGPSNYLANKMWTIKLESNNKVPAMHIKLDPNKVYSSEWYD